MLKISREKNKENEETKVRVRKKERNFIIKRHTEKKKY